MNGMYENLSVQTLTGKVIINDIERNPAGVGATVGVNFRF